MEEKKKYYFPPVGLGLWYQYGVLHSLPKNENYDLYGSSGGSIICFTSILKEIRKEGVEEDKEFKKNILV